MIKINNIKKSFKDKEVLKGITIEIKAGDFCGVFGRNGAGKSTLFKNILGLTKPTSGEILINGYNINHPINKNKYLIGYLPENIALYPYMNVRDTLKYAALSIGEDISKNRLKEILYKVNLEGSEKTKTADLSLGMKRRLQFALATMIGDPDIYILDEPTNGMDVNGVIWLKDFLSEFKKRNKTILVSSHSLNHMQDLISRFFILNNGNIVKEGKWPIPFLTNSYRMRFSGSVDDAVKTKICELGKIREAFNDEIVIESSKSIVEICKEFSNDQITLLDIMRIDVSLESMFLESIEENV